MRLLKSNTLIKVTSESHKSIFEKLVNSKFVKEELLKLDLKELNHIGNTHYLAFEPELEFYKKELLQLSIDNSGKYIYFPNDQLSIYHATSSNGIRYQIIICDPEELWHSADIFWIGILK